MFICVAAQCQSSFKCKTFPVEVGGGGVMEVGSGVTDLPPLLKKILKETLVKYIYIFWGVKNIYFLGQKLGQKYLFLTQLLG